MPYLNRKRSDARSYADKTSKRVLEDHAKRKKSKHLQPFLDRRRSFAPLIYSVDGMACKEARAFEKRIASLLAEKWNIRVCTGTDGDEHPALEYGVPEGGARTEADGAVGGRRRRV